ncbi:MAG: hypothetical protein PHV30_08520 [Candidatus Margulisbacteria bacterium]|nr:hypothetical protein [Candidatus Margulisiibacteriota bacterium]
MSGIEGFGAGGYVPADANNRNFDLNNDGKVSEDEFKSVLQTKFQEKGLDLNNDGKTDDNDVSVVLSAGYASGLDLFNDTANEDGDNEYIKGVVSDVMKSIGTQYGFQDQEERNLYNILYDAGIQLLT